MRHRYSLLILLLVFLAAVPDTPAQDEALSAKAVTIESPDFLKPPPGLDAKSFTLAKTAPKVDVCLFPGLKDRGKGTLWSSWGDGLIARSGKYYTSVGDHLGIDANCHVYEYNPSTNVLTRVVDVLQAIMQMLGLFGHGKIHSGLHEADDGKIYFTTYWGKPKEVDAAFTKGYPGSLLLRFDPKTGKTENLGAIVPKQGLPASFFDSSRQLLYFHSVYKGDIAVYDIAAAKVKFQGGADSSAAHRTFFKDAKGRVFFSGKAGLNYYDPETNKIVETKITLPAAKSAKKEATLRAAAPRPTKEGTVYGMTAAGELFAFDSKTERVKDLGPNWGAGDYTAVMALSPDEKYLYYAPGAHGSGAKSGAPVVQYNIASGERKALAFLQQPLLAKLSWPIGGTYNLQIDAKGETLFCTFNGAAPGARSPFGRPAVVVLHIPESERR
ncbi:MAG: hypothetical protein U0793_14380 [Gemmataceae bacterium]